VNDVTALILAGGRATRMGGVEKHLIEVDTGDGRRETILTRLARVLAPRVAEIVVAAARDASGFRTVRDPIEGVGPLAGIAAGLAAARTPWLLVVAGDMPYVTAAVVEQLLAARADAFDAIGVRANGLPEPLVCVLHARARAAVERRLAAGRYKASGLLTDEDLRVRWLDGVDPQALRNVNRPEDLRS